MFIYIANKYYGKKNSTTLYWMRLFLAFPEIRHFWIFEKPCTGIRIVLYFIIRNVSQNPLEALFLNIQIIGVWVIGGFGGGMPKGRGPLKMGGDGLIGDPNHACPLPSVSFIHPTIKKNLTSFRFVIDLSYLIRTRFIWGF